MRAPAVRARLRVGQEGPRQEEEDRIRKEIPMKYNLRFIEAFLKTKIKSWPHAGPIMIKEVDPNDGKEEQFLIHNWCVVQKQEGDGRNLEDLEFDFDVYKILRRFMFSLKNSRFSLDSRSNRGASSLVLQDKQGEFLEQDLRSSDHSQVY